MNQVIKALQVQEGKAIPHKFQPLYRKPDFKEVLAKVRRENDNFNKRKRK